MQRPPPKQVENYTDAFLVTAGGLLFMSLWLLAAVAGFLWVMVATVGLNHMVTVLGRRRMSR